MKLMKFHKYKDKIYTRSNVINYFYVTIGKFSYTSKFWKHQNLVVHSNHIIYKYSLQGIKALQNIVLYIIHPNNNCLKEHFKQKRLSSNIL